MGRGRGRGGINSSKILGSWELASPYVELLTQQALIGTESFAICCLEYTGMGLHRDTKSFSLFIFPLLKSFLKDPSDSDSNRASSTGACARG